MSKPVLNKNLCRRCRREAAKALGDPSGFTAWSAFMDSQWDDKHLVHCPNRRIPHGVHWVPSECVYAAEQAVSLDAD